MLYIHQTGIVHRDLKSHNILVDANWNIKLCDFGLAKLKDELSWGSGQFSGTPAYMAPELFERKGYDEKIDVFSFGTLMWEILARKIPFDGFEVQDIRRFILSDETLPLPKTVTNKEIGWIINNCRSIDPFKRPSFEQLCKQFN
jgi:serine/threonine protein kinase